MSEEFVKEYIKFWCMAVNSKESASIWKGNKNWTLYHMQNVLFPLAKELKYCDNACESEKCNNYPYCNNKSKCYGSRIQQEYYNIDLTLYTYVEQSRWTLDYAIEHENDGFKLKKNGEEIANKGWYDEFAKLLPIKCTEARVIIGYDDFKRFDDKIKKCLELLEFCENRNCVAGGKIILIIFPNSNYLKKLNMSRADVRDLIRIEEFEKRYNERKWEVKEITDIDTDSLKISYKYIKEVL